jgi:hypothetical protein
MLAAKGLKEPAREFWTALTNASAILAQTPPATPVNLDKPIGNWKSNIEWLAT